MTIELLLVNLLNNWILNARSAALVSLYNYLTPALNLAQPLGQNAHPSAHFPPSYSLCSGHSNQSSSPPEPSSSGLKPELSIPQNPNGRRVRSPARSDKGLAQRPWRRREQQWRRLNKLSRICSPVCLMLWKRTWWLCGAVISERETLTRCLKTLLSLRL